MRGASFWVFWAAGALGCGRPASVNGGNAVSTTSPRIERSAAETEAEGGAPGATAETKEPRPAELAADPPPDRDSVPLESLLRPERARDVPEPTVGLNATTRGGLVRLNAIGDALRRAAAECGCTERVVVVSASSQGRASELLGMLGLLEQAGFRRARVVVGDLSASFALSLSDAPRANDRVLRVIEPHFAWHGSKQSFDQLSEACGVETCAGAALSVAAYGSVQSLMEAAQSVRSGDVPVRLLVDRSPRPARPLKPRGKATNMIGELGFNDALEPMVADYGQLYRCLVESPAPEGAPPLDVSMSVGPDGALLSFGLRGKSAQTAPAQCLGRVLKQMAFRAPSFGHVTPIGFPFPLDSSNDPAH